MKTLWKILIPVAVTASAISFGLSHLPNDATTAQASAGLPSASSGEGARDYKRPDIRIRTVQPYIDQGMTYLGHCSGWNNVAACMETQDRFLRQYVNAFSGDYAAEKDVAFRLYGAADAGMTGATQKSPVQACAWLMVVEASGSPYLTRQDHADLVSVCSNLDQAGRSAAEERARTIGHTIIGARIRPIPVPQLDYDPKTGKNETQDAQP